jgi:hypothetical protein
MFWTVRLSIIKSLFTVHSAMVCHTGTVHTAFEQDQDRTAVPSRSCSKAAYKPVWHIPLLSVQWMNCWWWTDELSETCRVSWQNKFVTLVHLVGFIIKQKAEWHLLMSHYYHISSDTHVLLSIKIQVTESLQTWLVCNIVITVQSHLHLNSCAPKLSCHMQTTLH